MISHQDTEVLIGPIGEAVLRHLFRDTRLIMDETGRCQRPGQSPARLNYLLTQMDIIANVTLSSSPKKNACKSHFGVPRTH